MNPAAAPFFRQTAAVLSDYAHQFLLVLFYLRGNKISIISGEAARWDSKGFINPLAGGVRGGQRPPDKAVNQAQR